MENKIIMNEYNAKEMWKYLKQTVNLNKDNEGIRKVILDGILVENVTDLANGLNKFL